LNSKIPLVLPLSTLNPKSHRFKQQLDLRSSPEYSFEAPSPRFGGGAPSQASKITHPDKVGIEHVGSWVKPLELHDSSEHEELRREYGSSFPTSLSAYPKALSSGRSTSEAEMSTTALDIVDSGYEKEQDKHLARSLASLSLVDEVYKPGQEPEISRGAMATALEPNSIPQTQRATPGASDPLDAALVGSNNPVPSVSLEIEDEEVADSPEDQEITKDFFTDPNTLLTVHPTQHTGGRSRQGSSQGLSTTSQDTSSHSSKRSYQQGRREIEEGDGDDASSRKRPNRGPDDDVVDNAGSPTNMQMPCVLQQCPGTSGAPSMLIRDLRTSHHINICRHCYTRLESTQDKEAWEKLEKEHKLSGTCFQSCILKSCMKDRQHVHGPGCPPTTRFKSEEIGQYLCELLDPSERERVYSLVDGPGRLHISGAARRTKQKENKAEAELVDARDTVNYLREENARLELRNRELEDQLRTAEKSWMDERNRNEDKLRKLGDLRVEQPAQIPELKEIIETLLVCFPLESVLMPPFIDRLKRTCPKEWGRSGSYRLFSIPQTFDTISANLPSSSDSQFALPSNATSDGASSDV
jgi:hypothetical protein